MEIRLNLPAEDAEISFQTLEQKAFLSDPYRFAPHETEPTPRSADRSVPRPVRFDWTAEATESELQISAAPDFRECRTFPAERFVICPRRQGQGSGSEFSVFSVPVCNLPHGRRYYWRVMADGVCSPVRSFTVAADLPRWIRMPGVTNVRDLGGWKTRDGRTIRQEMIYRGSQFEAWNEGYCPCRMTESGRRVFFDELKIHTEVDLRGETPFLPVERSLSLSLQAYATWQEYGIFSDEQMAKVKQIFELLADASAYPVYFHCMGGGDRTGTTAFLLEAMLGVEPDSLIDDYELSNLSVSGERSRFSAVWVKFMEKLETFAPGKTVNDQVRAFLRKCGISDDTQARIQAILLD